MTPFVEYVWAAYGVSLVTLAATVALTVLSWRRAKRTMGAIQDSETNL